MWSHQPVPINKTSAGFAVRVRPRPDRRNAKISREPNPPAPLPLPLAPREGAGRLRAPAALPEPHEGGHALGRSPRRRPEPQTQPQRALARIASNDLCGGLCPPPCTPGSTAYVSGLASSPVLPCRHCASFGCFLDRRALLLGLGFIVPCHMFLISFCGMNAGGWNLA
jgi:hypothetical protein